MQLAACRLQGEPCRSSGASRQEAYTYSLDSNEGIMIHQAVKSRNAEGIHLLMSEWQRTGQEGWASGGCSQLWSIQDTAKDLLMENISLLKHFSRVLQWVSEKDCYTGHNDPLETEGVFYHGSLGEI